MQVEAVGALTVLICYLAKATPTKIYSGYFTVMNGEPHETPFVARAALKTGKPVLGPAVLVEETGTKLLNRMVSYALRMET